LLYNLLSVCKIKWPNTNLNNEGVIHNEE